jgi:hypothetical protein
MPFATGRESWALCDICGQRCRYRELKQDVFNQRFTGLLVCDDCYDKDNPQLQVGVLTARAEGIALQNPRPDNPDWVSRGWVSWNPVQGLGVQFTVGKVSVITT